MSKSDTSKQAELAYRTLQVLAAFDPESFRRTEVLDRQNGPSEAVGIAKIIIAMHAPISLPMLEMLPEQVGSTFLSVARRAQSAFELMLKYNPKEYTPDSWENCVEHLRNLVKERFTEHADLYARIHAGNTYFADIKRELERHDVEISRIFK